MLAKYFSIIRNYVLTVSSKIKYTFYHQNTLLDAFRTNSRNIIGRNPSMVISLLANQDLTPMLGIPMSIITIVRVILSISCLSLVFCCLNGLCLKNLEES